MVNNECHVLSAGEESVLLTHARHLNEVLADPSFETRGSYTARDRALGRLGFTDPRKAIIANFEAAVRAQTDVRKGGGCSDEQVAFLRDSAKAALVELRKSRVGRDAQ